MTSGPYTLTAVAFGSTWSELDADAQDVIAAFRSAEPASIHLGGSRDRADRRSDREVSTSQHHIPRPIHGDMVTAMTRALLALVSLIGWLIDHHVQTANRHAVRRITKEKP